LLPCDISILSQNDSWSAYESGGADDDGGECGVGSDDTYWYMGRTPCYRANAAYSLYGVLKGSLQTQYNQGCRKGTFINSVRANTVGMNEAQKKYSFQAHLLITIF
jgi:hypothetical protein